METISPLHLFHYRAQLDSALFFPFSESIVSAICEFCAEEHSEGRDQAEAAGSFFQWQTRCANKALFPCLYLWLERDLFH